MFCDRHLRQNQRAKQGPSKPLHPQQQLRGVLLTALLLQGEQGGWIKATADLSDGECSVLEKGTLSLAGGKSQVNAHEKTVQLRLRQRAGAHLIQAVLGRDNNKRMRQGVADAIHAHPLPLWPPEGHSGCGGWPD